MEDYRQAVILSGMLFTLVIWIFSAIGLLLSALFFVFFLWHYIPRADGGLTGFCERKINKRLKQIVSVKINKAMAEDERKRKKAEMKAAMKNGESRPMTMIATLPNVGDDKLPEMPSLSRTDTMASSRPSTPGSFELSAMDQKRPLPNRTGTTATYSSRASLLGGAAEFGTTRSGSPTPTLPPTDLHNFPPVRTGTVTSNNSFGGGPQLQRMASNGSTLGAGYSASPADYSSATMPAFPSPIRSPVNAPDNHRGPGTNMENGRSYSNGGRPPYDDFSSGRASPAPSSNGYRGGPLSPRATGPDGYPVRSATNPMPQRGPQQYPQRNMTGPIYPQHQSNESNSSLRSMPNRGPPTPFSQPQGNGEFDYMNRPGTANSQRGPLQRNMTGSVRSQHQQNDSNGSLRSMPSRQPFDQAQGNGGDYDYMGRPATANSQRNAPRGGYENNRWNQDIERGNGPRY
jgi:Fungal potassium channel